MIMWKYSGWITLAALVSLLWLTGGHDVRVLL